MNVLNKLIVGRTVLVISHRLNSLFNVDEIIVLSGGKIVEKGTFKELKRAGGVFAGLLEEQNRYSAEQAEKSMRFSFAALPPELDPRQIQPTPAPQPKRPVPISARPAPVPVAAAVAGGGGNGNRQEPQQARVLIELDGKVIGERRLDKPVLTIGRLSSNDVQIPSQRVSRLHARIRWENGAWLIEDSESTNGITFEGNRVDHHILSNRDQIVLAPRIVLRYEAI
jgi:ABC-type glutathione transport system ATPase component